MSHEGFMHCVTPHGPACTLHDMSVSVPPGKSLSSVLEEKSALAMRLFNAVFGMELQLEQWGTQIDFLGAKLCDVSGPNPIKKKGPATLGL